MPQVLNYLSSPDELAVAPAVRVVDFAEAKADGVVGTVACVYFLIQ